MANVNPIMTVIVDVCRGGEKEVAPNADNSRQEIGGGGVNFRQFNVDVLSTQTTSEGT